MMKQREDKASDNLYTPDWLVDLIVDFYGGQIDLDPSADPQKRIPAHHHYTFEDNGLNKEWNGNVFCNPPYSRNNGTTIADWVDKSYDAVKKDSTCLQTQVLLLLPASTDTKWGQQLFGDRDSLTKILLLRGRIKFLGRDYAPTPSVGLFPSILVYIGFDRFRFQSIFEGQGVII